MFQSKIGRRLLGLVLLSLGSGVTVWSWYTALNEGYYYTKAVTVFPAFAVLGIGMLLFPIYVEKPGAEHGLEEPAELEHFLLGSVSKRRNLTIPNHSQKPSDERHFDHAAKVFCRLFKT